MNEPIFLLLIALLPAVVVFLTAYHIFRQYLRSRALEQAGAQKDEGRKQLLPLRLQAYERLALFLERIEPGPLVLRVHKSNMSSSMLHGALVATIREEFEHNVTQQIFVSDKLWAKVRQAKEETIRLVNISFQQSGEVNAGTNLSRQIFENVSRLSGSPSQEAMLLLKDEVRRLF